MTYSKEKKAEYNKKYYQLNKEKRREYNKKWRGENIEKRRECDRKYYELNKEKRAEYRELNKEKIREKKAEYYQLNNEKISEYHKAYRDKRRAYCLEYLGGKCVECGTTHNLQFDHIKREGKKYEISNRLSNNLNNLKEELDKCQLLCAPCHLDKTAKEWVDMYN